MSKPVKTDAKALWDRLQMIREGVVMLDGVRHVLMPASILTDIEAAGERILGRGLGAILYDAGYRSGTYVCEAVRRSIPPSPPAAILENIESGGRARGFGAIEFVSHDIQEARFALRVHESPHAEVREPRRGSACFYPLGFWAGVAAVLTGRPIEGEETSCLARGDGFCEFQLRPRT